MLEAVVNSTLPPMWYGPNTIQRQRSWYNTKNSLAYQHTRPYPCPYILDYIMKSPVLLSRTSITLLRSPKARVVLTCWLASLGNYSTQLLESFILFSINDFVSLKKLGLAYQNMLP